jgi:hypothetical protein
MNLVALSGMRLLLLSPPPEQPPPACPNRQCHYPAEEPESRFPPSDLRGAGHWLEEAAIWRRGCEGNAQARADEEERAAGRNGGPPPPVKRRRVAASATETLDMGWNWRGERENDWWWGLRGRVWGCARTSESGISYLLFTPAKVYLCCVYGLVVKLGPVSTREDIESKVSLIFRPD